MSNRIGAALLAGMLALVACDDSPAGLPDLAVASVTVTPTGQTITTGQTMQLTAYPKTADGTVLGGRPTVWTSSAENVATVSAAGVVRALGAGNATITASVEGKSGSVQVSVVNAPLQVATIQIVNVPAGLEVGQQVMLEAILKAADGTLLGGRAVTWTTSHGPTATVDVDPNPAYALVSAHAPGPVTITAQAEGRTASVNLVVGGQIAVGSVLVGPSDAEIFVHGGHTFTALVRMPDGRPHPNPPAVVWSVDDPTIATVDASGRVRANKAGTTPVRATAGGVQGAVILTVKTFLVPGQQQFGVLADVDPNGEARTVELGTLTWYGEKVEGQAAREILKSGTITLETANGVTQYAHLVYFDVVLVEDGRTVGFGSITNTGTVSSMSSASFDGPVLQFTSSNPQNLPFVGRVVGGDRIVTTQMLGAAPNQEYAWVRK